MNPENMTEKERIDFIREYGSEQQKRGIEAIFGRNKYKPKRKEMWDTRLCKGIRMVKTIISKNNGEHIESEDGINEDVNEKNPESFMDFVK